MRPSLRAVVEAEDADDDALEIVGDQDRPGTAAKGPSAGWSYSWSVTPKAALIWATVPASQTLRRASLVSTTARWCAWANATTLAISSADAPWSAASCLAGQVVAHVRRSRCRRGQLDGLGDCRAGPKPDRHFEPLVTIGRSDLARTRHGGTMAARQRYMVRLR